MKHKYLTFLLIIILPLLIFGCATKKPCPSQDVIIFCPYLDIPIMIPEGTFKKENEGKKWITKKEFEEKLENGGCYYARMSETEYIDLSNDRNKLNRLISMQIKIRIEKWLNTISEQIKKNKLKVLVMPGNDDTFSIDEIILNYEEKGVKYPINRIIDIDSTEIVSLEYVNTSPFNTPREAREKDLEVKIDDQVLKLQNLHNSIFNFHPPPFKTKLDLAPKIGKNKKPVIRAGQIEKVHAGSKAVLKAIKKYQPFIGLHGHIHESGGADKIGNTVILNPGSEYGEGIFKAFVIEINASSRDLSYWHIDG